MLLARARPLCRAVVCAVALVLLSCARPGDPPIPDRYKPALRAALVFGVGELCVRHPAAIPQVLGVVVVVQDVLNAGTFTSIPVLEQAVRARVPWDRIPLAARPAVDALLVLFFGELQAVIEWHQVPQTQIVGLVHEAAGWVQEAAARCVIPTGRS